MVRKSAPNGQNSDDNFGSQLSSENRAQTERLPKTRENDPTALDVILGLINEEDETKASEYMKGHLEQDVINDTFLMDA